MAKKKQINIHRAKQYNFDYQVRYYNNKTEMNNVPFTTLHAAVDFASEIIDADLKYSQMHNIHTTVKSLIVENIINNKRILTYTAE